MQCHLCGGKHYTRLINLGKLEQGKCRIWRSGRGEARGRTEHLSLLFEKNQLFTWLLLTAWRWAIIRQGHFPPTPAGVHILRVTRILTQARTESCTFNASIKCDLKFTVSVILLCLKPNGDKKPLNISYSQTVFKLMLEFKMVSCGLALCPKISSQMAKGIK